ncbi:MAG: peptidoglycan DD-metalloendopeptidase family protein [Chlorobi bacterium]|nr:peptidoglycan DD-metalloendopeptidase family protein [Chlorobiota bacterium]MCI0715098.1 peptidoglycan DD-metalloendopeptidase family protein [Chlorobiota bacterium]
MAVNKTVRIGAFFSLLCLIIGATYEEILNDKKEQADIIEKQIIQDKNLLGSYSFEIAELKKETDSLESTLNALNNFLKDYENAVYLSPLQIAAETNNIINLESEVGIIQESFRQRIVNLYKKGKNYELELLLSAKTPNEYLRRNQYLQTFSQSRKKELRELKAKKFMLEEKKKFLELSTSSKRFFIESKRREKSELQKKFNDFKKRKDDLEFKTSVIVNKISRHGAQLNNTVSFINNFEANRNNFKENKINRLNYDSFDLNNVKGKINLPVDIPLVINSFGDNVNNSTLTKSFNNGVDFSIAKGSKVYAVTEGYVSLIGELPYYGKVIIIKHNSGFRSVYAALDEVNLTLGDNVKLNQIIGKTGETLDGQMFHFELWQNSTPLNPLEWLRF